ncbi:hypothetical protein AXG93_641s1000 [Marchantia polymorpha subsp. ruderalis]|uniref:P-type ATPase A domain-containing protein n=1 Tax=Marchantia polymorpha subsp. ruderalis TaxID=1480154 RepID=A0A176W0U0_MARPO|nr:hypothetical protein AXG93_641s1000 [Marchantia polymorpha subsp. ruderalis]
MFGASPFALMIAPLLPCLDLESAGGVLVLFKNPGANKGRKVDFCFCGLAGAAAMSSTVAASRGRPGPESWRCAAQQHRPERVRLLEGDPLKIDQSALTEESLPVTKHPGDGVYSGSTCKQGEVEAVVIATGVHSFFGKAAHLVDSTDQVGHFQKVLTAIGNFFICSIAIGMLVEIVVMFAIQDRKYRAGIDNLLVLLIGGIPIAMPTVLSVTMAIGSHRLAQQGAITKRMTAIEEMAGMDVLCSDKTGTLTLNKLTVDKNLIETFTPGVDKDMVVLLAARASRTENQDTIDAAIVNMLADPKEARAGVQEIHFLPFNPTDKRTALTYVDNEGPNKRNENK